MAAPYRRFKHPTAPHSMWGALLLMLFLPFVTGCLTTLAISAAAGSGGDNNYVEAAKETAGDAVDMVRDAADNTALSAHDAVTSITDSAD